MRKGPILSFLAGFSVIFLVALTTDQIMQNVYDSSNTALRVNQVAGGGSASSITSGTTTITSGANTSVCFDDAGVINCGNANFLFTKSTTVPMLTIGTWQFWKQNNANFFEIQNSARTRGDLYLFTGVDTGGGNLPDDTGIGFENTSGEDMEIGVNGASSNQGTVTNIPNTGFVAEYVHDLYVGSNTALHFFTGGTALSNENWNITSTGQLLTVAAGLGISLKEGSAVSGSAGQDIIYPDSTAHRLAMNNNNGTAINVAGFITGTASITPGTITASQCADSGTTITVTGAGTNDPCMLGPPTAGAGTHISATCYISGASTATVRFCNSNTSNQTGTTGTYRATVVH